MSPAILALIVQGLQAAIEAAPQIASVVAKAKDLISELFAAGVITAQQQADVHQHVDATCAAALAGRPSPAWQVQPDPA